MERRPYVLLGRVDTLTPFSLPYAIRRLYSYIDDLENEVIVTPIRRRLYLERLSHLRDLIQGRVEYLVQKSRLQVNKGETIKHISAIAVLKLISEPGKPVKENKHVKENEIAARLRAGERYGQLPSGILLTLGNVTRLGM